MNQVKRKISLTRALAEVKLLESKLSNPKVGFDIIVNKGLKNNPQFNEETFIKTVKSEKESFEQLFLNRSKLKLAIAKANTNTLVQCSIYKDKKEVSIIELIDFKSASSYKLDILNSYIRDFGSCNHFVQGQVNKIEQEVSKQVESAMQNKNNNSKDLSKTLTDTYTELWGAKVIGLDIEEIKKEKEDLETLLADIDMTLSEVNSKTEIELDF